MTGRRSRIARGHENTKRGAKGRVASQGRTTPCGGVRGMGQSWSDVPRVRGHRP